MTTEVMYIINDIKIFEISIRYKIVESIVHIIKDPIRAIFIDVYASVTKIKRKNIFIPISNGTIDTACDAKFTPLFIAIKINAIIIVDGKVPSIPPIFVPYFSAIIVMIITISADRINGRTDCIRNVNMKWDRIGL